MSKSISDAVSTADARAHASAQHLPAQHPVASRRVFLVGAGAAALAAPTSFAAAGMLAQPPVGTFDPPICRVAADTPAVTGPLKKVTFAWNATAACLPTITSAKEKGFFEKNGLDVDLINYSGSTDQLLETLATGKADAAVGMALRWIKPLEQGFDVKIVAGIHGGCLRLLAPADSGITKLQDLKGKSIAVSDMNSPAKNFFAILFKKAGIDPDTDINYKIYPAPLLRAAVEKGEAQALADGDPNTFTWQKDKKFVEIVTNLSGDYATRTCCIIGVSGRLIREDKKIAAAITRAIIEAADFTAHHPEESAATLAPFVTNISPDELAGLAHYHTHHNHPTGDALRAQIELYAEDLKLVSVLKPRTDPAKYAERVVADVLSL